MRARVAAGELVFYSAELTTERVMPESGTLHRVAPPTAPAEALAAAPQPDRLEQEQQFLTALPRRNAMK